MGRRFLSVFPIFIFLLSGIGTVYGQWVHPSKTPSIAHEINYLDSWGSADVSEGGVSCHHDRLMAGTVTKVPVDPVSLNALFGAGRDKRPKTAKAPLHLTAYPFYYPDMLLRYQIKLTNTGRDKFNGLKAVIIHKYLDGAGKWLPLPDQPSKSWEIGGLDIGQSIVLSGNTELPRDAPRFGLLQMYLQIRRKDKQKEMVQETVLMDAMKTVAWCPAPGQ